MNNKKILLPLLVSLLSFGLFGCASNSVPPKENDEQVEPKPSEEEIQPTVKCTIKFDLNGGTGEMASVSVNLNGQYTLPECTAIPPEGKAFNYYSVNNETKHPGDVITVTSNLTIKLVWVVSSFNVTFDANGGSGTMKVDTGRKTYTLPECSFTAPEGKKFDHWEIANKKRVPGQKISISSDLVVKAIWNDPNTIVTNKEFKEVVEKDREVDLVRSFGLESYSPNKSHIKRAIRVTPEDNMGANYSILTTIYDLENMINEKVKEYSKLALGIMNGSILTDSSVTIGKTENGDSDFIIIEDDTGDKYTSKYNDIFTSQRKTRTFFMSEDGFEIYIKYYDVTVNPMFVLDGKGDMDSHYRVKYVPGTDIVNEVSASLISDYYGYLVKDYFTMHKEDGKVCYSDYKRYFDLEGGMFGWDELSTALFYDGISISCAFENRYGSQFYPDTLLENDDKVFWTIQVSDGVNGDIRLFPFADVVTVGANFVDGWDVMLFENNFDEIQVDFRGCLASGLITPNENFGFLEFEDEPYRFYPLASLLIGNPGSYYPGRLCFGYRYILEDDKDRDFYSLFEEASIKLGLTMNCPDSMRNFLSNFKTGDQYNLEEIGKFAPVSDLTRWINEPIDEILISSQYSSDILKQILEDRGL